MKAPYTGEVCTAITQSMCDALAELIRCRPAPHFVPNMATAVALLNRGWIEKAMQGEHVCSKSMYNITDCGLTAYRIGARAPGVTDVVPRAEARPINHPYDRG